MDQWISVSVNRKFPLLLELARERRGALAAELSGRALTSFTVRAGWFFGGGLQSTGKGCIVVTDITKSEIRIHQICLKE